jgi:hypothetical protein
MSADPDPPGLSAGGGEMGALMRSFAWSRAPVGDPSGWPHACGR